jgi:succinoglycan biosynthesis transport protein ExoP
MDPNTSTENSDVRDYLRPIWAHRWLILAVVVIATAATYFYYASKPKQYRAGTSLYVKASQLDQILFGVDTTSATNPQRENQNLATLLQSRVVANEVSRRLNHGTSGRGVPGSIVAVPSQDSDFVSITATSANPNDAARVANAYAQAFINVQSGQVRQKTQDALDVAKAQLQHLSGSASTGARRSLESRIGQLNTILSLPAGSAQQVDPAVAPSVAFAPRPKRNAGFALVISLLLAIGAAYGLERLDRRIKGLDELESVYRLTLLGALPWVKDAVATQGGQVTVSNSLRESFRTISTNIQLATLDTPLRTLLVTSAVPEEGKTTVVRNLALTYREAGLKVAVIESDLRHPTLAASLLTSTRPGLTEVLAGHSSLESALQHVETNPEILAGSLKTTPVAAGGSQNGVAAEVASGTLSVLPSGPQPPNPPAVLAADRVRALVDELASRHDVVLIDSAPLLAVSDAIPLLSIADGTILVTRLGRVTRDSARRTTELLNRVPDARILGIVANDVPARDLTSGYGYGFYGYQPED